MARWEMADGSGGGRGRSESEREEFGGEREELLNQGRKLKEKIEREREQRTGTKDKRETCREL
jgi:hypothetical protein